jgi:polysaccharide deacetylase family protein (PEP-CTERM system associated)
MRHALTVDVEEWFHVCGIERVVPAAEWDRLESRVETATRRVLDLLDEFDTRATFFVLGWVAQRHPELVRTIRDAGHEIASHGMWHRRVFHLTPAQFEADLRESRDLLTSIVGAPPTAFRAPEWSIDAERREWAYPILAKLGFRDDSSVSPITWISGSRLETRPFLWRETLRVFPTTTVRLFWENLPFTGGMGLRTTAYWYTAWQFEQLDRRGAPGMIYLHPWEFDLSQPKLPLGGVLDFVHRFNLRAVERNVRGLLKHFEFAPLSDALDPVVPRPSARASDALAPVEPLAREPAREESVA